MKNFGSPFKIGIISDTHGLLRPEVFEAFHDVDQILHAGDICSDIILDQLAQIAPVIAVCGNSDFTPRCRQLPNFEIIKICNMEAYLSHGHNENFNCIPTGANLIISGHTHQPRIESFGGILRINPGSAGPRRPHTPVSVGIFTIYNKARSAEIIELPS